MILDSEPIKDIKPDPRGRVALGADCTKGVSHYKMFMGDEGEILLVPYVDIPQRELWLFSDKKMMRQLEESFKNAETGKLKDIDPEFMEYDQEE